MSRQRARTERVRRAGAGIRRSGLGSRHRFGVYRTLALGLWLAGCGAAPEVSTGPSDGLVLVQIHEGSAELVRARITDGATQALTRTPEREESWPYWSQAARRLVFQVRRGARDSDLVLWSEEHGEKPLGETAGREERWPAWAPRTARLAYAMRAEGGPAGLAIADYSAGRQQVIARSGDRDVFLRPSWSPLGDQLAAQRRLPSGAGSRLWLVRPGARPVRIGDEAGWFEYKPHFTRDGQALVFSRRRTGAERSQIAHLDLATKERRRLAAHREASDHSARPSPTRDEVAFVSDREGRSAIFVVDLASDTVRRLSEVPGAAYGPRWSPDGERIAFTVAPPDGAEPRLADQASLAAARVLVVDRSGALLADLPGVMPDWMPPWP